MMQSKIKLEINMVICSDKVDIFYVK